MLEIYRTVLTCLNKRKELTLTYGRTDPKQRKSLLKIKEKWQSCDVKWDYKYVDNILINILYYVLFTTEEKALILLFIVFWGKEWIQVFYLCYTLKIFFC